jgi:hypothetical protein
MMASSTGLYFVLSFLSYCYLGTYTYIPLTLYLRRGSRGISVIPPRHPHFSKIIYLWVILQTWQVVKPIAVWSQSISCVNAINPIVTFYDIHGRKSEVLFFYFVPDTTRDKHISDILTRHPHFTKKHLRNTADVTAYRRPIGINLVKNTQKTKTLQVQSLF